MIGNLKEQNYVTTIQPYTINQTMCYYRSKACLNSGISMLYSFQNGNKGYTVVGDACADIMIHYSKDKEDIGMDLVGPHDHLEYLKLKEGYTYFGIRFLPGYSPEVAGAELLDLKGETVPLHNNALYYELLKKVREEDNFFQQCREIMNCLFGFQKLGSKETSQSRLHQSILDVILCSTQNQSLKKLEQYSGYSARYLNKVFRERTGYSIMQFSNVLRAQRVSNFLDGCKKNQIIPSFDEIAADLGYSDQSHMIREFKKHFGMTPKTYFQKYC